MSGLFAKFLDRYLGFLQVSYSFLQTVAQFLQNLKSGSTATCVFIDGNSVYFAWLGDSQVALIDKSGKCSFVSARHDTKNQVGIELYILDIIVSENIAF